VLARLAHAHVKEQLPSVGWLDLQDTPLPLCDGAAAYSHPAVATISEQIKNAGAILLATPVYNYDANAAAKNLIELTGKAWENKLVGFLCAAGGNSSYMSIMSLANSLMLDFRCIILPRFVYAAESSFADGQLTDPKVLQRIAQLGDEWLRLGALLAA
jgi:FMN reductase